MDCETARARSVDAFLDDTPRPSELDVHLDRCAACRDHVERLAAAWAALGALPLVGPSRAVGRRLARRVWWEEARGVLGRLLATADTTAAPELAVSIGDTWAGQGNQAAAAEYYMTAAYLVPESPEGRRALLAAGRAFAAAKDPDSAAIVFRKLIAQKDTPADLAEAARRALTEIRR